MGHSIACQVFFEIACPYPYSFQVSVLRGMRYLEGDINLYFSKVVSLQ